MRSAADAATSRCSKPEPRFPSSAPGRPLNGRDTRGGTVASARYPPPYACRVRRSARAGRDLPLVVPGLVLLEELGEARMDRDLRIGVDALHLHADEVLCHRGEARI